MVSVSCKIFVKAELEKLGMTGFIIKAGIIEFEDELPKQRLEELKQHLFGWRLELLDDKKGILAEKIKNVIIEMIHYPSELLKVNYSQHISEKLNYNYAYLAYVFAEETGKTIREFIIDHKIEKVKEFLADNELSLAQIASKMHYSSAAHLSNQFKKATGLTPSFYKSNIREQRSGFENV
jgi:AraC-like DNA-binding protein